MIFGKHINRYYLRFAPLLVLGLAALVMVDVFQLEIPELYRKVINGVNQGEVWVDGAYVPFDMDFLLDGICMPMVKIILCMVFGRFLWRGGSGGIRPAGPDVRPCQGLKPGILPGEQGGRPDEPVHQ